MPLVRSKTAELKQMLFMDAETETAVCRNFGSHGIAVINYSFQCYSYSLETPMWMLGEPWNPPSMVHPVALAEIEIRSIPLPRRLHF